MTDEGADDGAADGAGHGTAGDDVREYDKLVRDDIPRIVSENGEVPVAHVVDGDEYRRRLCEKLLEEAREVRDEPVDGDVDPGELADVLAVVHALADAAGVSMAEVDRLRREKRDVRGGFDDGVVLERVRDPE